jgi:hypothetical protein
MELTVLLDVAATRWREIRLATAPEIDRYDTPEVRSLPITCAPTV